MRLQNDTNSTQVESNPLTTTNTTMVTSIVSPPPNGKLDKKVKIVLQNKRVRVLFRVRVHVLFVFKKTKLICLGISKHFDVWGAEIY